MAVYHFTMVEIHCMERISIFVDVDPYTTTKKTRVGKSPLQLARLAHRHLEIKQYLLHKQMTCLQAIREAFNDATGDQCCFPDVLQAIMWSYTNEDVGEEEDDWECNEEPDEEEGDLENSDNELDEDEDGLESMRTRRRQL